MTIRITPNDTGNPPGKLADAELHFDDGPLAGLKLIGFGIWERRGGSWRNVTFPARQYSVNGERRAFALLRPASELGSQDAIKALILEAYSEFESAHSTVDNKCEGHPAGPYDLMGQTVYCDGTCQTVTR